MKKIMQGIASVVSSTIGVKEMDEKKVWRGSWVLCEKADRSQTKELVTMDAPAFESLVADIFGSSESVAREVALEKLFHVVGSRPSLGTVLDCFKGLPSSVRCASKPFIYKATFAAFVRSLGEKARGWDDSLPFLHLTDELKRVADEVVRTCGVPPYDGVPAILGNLAGLECMSHGGPKTPSPFLLSPPLHDIDKFGDNENIELKDPTMVAGKSDGFQVFRWCTVETTRQFIPLKPMAFLDPAPCSCVNYADQRLVMCQLGGFELRWRGSKQVSSMITLDHDGHILFTLFPEYHPVEAAEASTALATSDNVRFLLIDVSLKSPAADADADAAVAARGSAGGGSGSEQCLFANKDIALLVCRKMDQRTLGRIAQCSRALNSVVATARFEYIRSCVFSTDQISKTATAAQLMQAHCSRDFFRLSAVYGPIEPGIEGAAPQTEYGNFGEPKPRVEPARYVLSFVMELRHGGKEAVRSVTLARENQFQISRMMFVD